MAWHKSMSPVDPHRKPVHPLLGGPGLKILVQCQCPLTAEHMPQPQLFPVLPERMVLPTETTSTPRDSGAMKPPGEPRPPLPSATAATASPPRDCAAAPVEQLRVVSPRTLKEHWPHISASTERLSTASRGCTKPLAKRLSETRASSAATKRIPQVFPPPHP